MNFPIEPFGSQHDRKSFSCGNEALDTFFRERVRKEVEAECATAFVMADGSSVLGYYTLSSLMLSRTSIPEDVVKRLKLPKYEYIPATLMGRLAVDQKYQGQRIGELLLLDASRRSCESAATGPAAFAVIVDAKENAVQFYLKYSFIQIPSSNRVFIPMKTVRQLFKKPEPQE